MNSLNLVLLAGNPQQGGGGMVQLVMMGAIILVFWLFMIRPQAKKAKDDGAKELGVSEERIEQIYHKGIRKLKATNRSRLLKQYVS